MSDTGVVDPMRIPPWLREPVEEAWRETPAIARLFIGLALVDIVSRGLGILQPRVDVRYDLFAPYSFLVPHDLWILLPAILLLRRPDAARATAHVFWGAVVVAVSTALERPLTNLLQDAYGATASSIEIGVVASMAKLVAWLLIARGLVELSPARPTPTVAGLANGVLAIAVTGVFVQLARSLVGGFDLGVPGLSGALALSTFAGAAEQGAWLYLLWVVIRGLGDARRSRVATTAAGIGASIAAALGGIGAIFGVVASAFLSTPSYADLAAMQGFSYVLYLVTFGVGEALVILAFAMGLAEPLVPYEPPAAPGTGASHADAIDEPARGEPAIEGPAIREPTVDSDAAAGA